MDSSLAFQIAVAIGAILFGSEGIVAFFRARRTRAEGLPREESAAREVVTPNWDSLTAYYRSELNTLRDDMRNELSVVRRQVLHLSRLREIDAGYIDALEAHIWQQKAPPPPPRPQYPGNDAGGIE